MNLLRKITLILGIIITIYITIFCLLSNFNIGNLMVMFTGVFLIFLATLYPKIAHKKIVKIFKYIFVIGYAFLIGMIIFIVIASNTHKADYTEDAVIVLGCGIKGENPTLTLIKRLDKAVEYSTKNKDCIIIVSGGQGPQEDISEAEAMYRYLVLKGVDGNRIKKEDKSTSTNENFKFSKQILDNLINSDYTVAYITNDFHNYRAGRLAQINGLRAKGCPSATDLYSIPPSYMREVLAVIQLFVFKV